MDNLLAGIVELVAYIVMDVLFVKFKKKKEEVKKVENQEK